MGVIYVVSSAGRFGFLDSHGNPLTDYEFDKYYKYDSAGCVLVEKEGKKGLVNCEGLVTPCTYDKIESFVYYGFIKVVKNGKTGLINEKGKEIIPCLYDNIYVNKGNPMTVTLDGKYGVVNTLGEEIIPCIYDHVERFAEGIDVTFVKIYDKSFRYALINRDGVLLTPFIYSGCQGFDDNTPIAPVEIDNKWGCIDTKGNTIVPFVYSYMHSFVNGLCGVSMNEKEGFIDTKGRLVIPCIYKECSIWYSEGYAEVLDDFSYLNIINKKNKVLDVEKSYGTSYDDKVYFREGLGITKIDGKYGFIDIDGNLVIPCKYDKAGPFINGFAEVMIDGRWGFINKSGQNITPYKYSQLCYFYGGYAEVKGNRYWGVVNTNGDEIVPCEYSFNNFSIDKQNELIIVEAPNSLYGIYDLSGNIISPCYYSEIKIYHTHIIVETNEKYGVIDKTGATVLPFIYDGINDEYEGNFIVKKDGKYGVVDYDNNIIIPFIYSNAQIFADGLIMVSVDSKSFYLIDLNNNKISSNFFFHGFFDISDSTIKYSYMK